jgi:glutamate---cysteine ligase / carboxylate-amine ligase
VTVLPTPESLRAVFDPDRPMTVGIEEELMLLDAATLDLAPHAPEVLARLPGDKRFKLELPAAQLEILTAPAASVAQAARALAAARHELAAAAAPQWRLAGGGAHPFAATAGPLNPGERYDALIAEYGPVARRQLVFGMHVHVAIGDAARAVAVHDALRGYLPEVAALAANAPFYAGADSGLESVRPKIADLLPRQGVPPAIGGVEQLAAAYRWGSASGAFAPAQWWYELRLHPVHGTVEVRVPDTQATVADTAAIAAVVHALVADLTDRVDAGTAAPPAPSWRIEANRWSACRHGLGGQMADLRSGELVGTRERVRALIGGLEPVAERLGCAVELAHARALAEQGGAERQRGAAGRDGARGAAGWLAERFLG